MVSSSVEPPSATFSRRRNLSRTKLSGTSAAEGFSLPQTAPVKPQDIGLLPPARPPFPATTGVPSRSGRVKIHGFPKKNHETEGSP